MCRCPLQLTTRPSRRPLGSGTAPPASSRVRSSSGTRTKGHGATPVRARSEAVGGTLVASAGMSASPRHVLVAVAWPYANGVQHVGHLAGAYLPADIFARYHRIAGNRVLMVSGSDAHGTPITVKAEQEGVTPRDIVNRYHPLICEQWDRFGISFDLFTTTMTDNHRDVTWDLFRQLHADGYIGTKVTEQFYDPEAERFLPGPLRRGHLPALRLRRGARRPVRQLRPDARPDRPDRPALEADRGRHAGAARDRALLPAAAQDAGAAARVARGPRGLAQPRHQLGARVRAGGPDRPRDHPRPGWGVPMPPELDTIGDGKRIYVWFEAVIGYLSAGQGVGLEDRRPRRLEGAGGRIPTPSPTTSSARTTSRSTPCSGRSYLMGANDS